MKKAYLFALFYFCIFGVLLLASGIWVFAEKAGFAPQDVMMYYGGDESAGIPAKSLYGQLEVVVPHLGAMGLFIMVCVHFMMFVPRPRWHRIRRLSIVAFLSALASIGSGILISEGYAVFAFVKLAALVLFYVVILSTLGVLLFESGRTLHHARAL